MIAFLQLSMYSNMDSSTVCIDPPGPSTSAAFTSSNAKNSNDSEAGILLVGNLK